MELSVLGYNFLSSEFLVCILNDNMCNMIYFILISVFLFGLIIGSFLNCLVWRIHKKESAWGRSYCPRCKSLIAWFDNVPVLSFLFLRGKCRKCKKAISWQYPIVELVTGGLFVAAFLVNQESGIMNQADLFTLIPNSLFLIQLVFDWFIISVLIMVFIFDLRWYIIPDIVTLPAIVIALAYQLIFNIQIWQNIAISGIIGLGFFLVQFLISRGKWIGGGDLRLGLLMGIVLLWPKIFAAIVVSYLLGSFVGIYLLATRKKGFGSKLPLGTFLVPGTLLIMFFGDEIVEWYVSLIAF